MSDNQLNAPNVTSMRKIELQELDQTGAGNGLLFDEDLSMIGGIKVRLAVSVGACELTIQDLFALKEDSLLQLNKPMAEPVDIFLGDKLIARGNLVAVDDDFGVKITEIIRTARRE